MDRAAIVEEKLRHRLMTGDLPATRPPQSALTANDAIDIFRAQCQSRALDLQSRVMQAAGQGFYTIGSSGHEGMAAVAHALRPTDPAFLHYRDGAFQIARSHQVSGQDMVRDMLLSFACSSDDPISGGRHKVLGSKALNIPPQTSTIASHLPKAVGAAYSIAAARRHEPEHEAFARDAIIVCSFGDASANHSTAQGAFNTAQWASFQNAPMPILFICEDNGIGISTKTPTGWIEASFSSRSNLKYFQANGLDLFETHRVAAMAAQYVRTRRKPVFLHLNMVRLYGHAGADVATSYLSKQEVEADEANDPLVHSAALLNAAEVMEPAAALDIYDEIRQQVVLTAAQIVTCPHLETASDVMASLIPLPRHCQPTKGPSSADRAAVFENELSAQAEPQPMNRLINWALTDLMMAHREIIMMGEDIGRKGGVYGVTQKLRKRFGRDRVIDTLLDEQSILGLAIGMAHNGFVPIPEIQFLAYLHNAEDQLRGEAATLPFFSSGQFTNPMVVRIAGLGYQKGFGGYFHNDNSVAVLRDIPGLILASPSNGADAVRMVRECVRLAREEQRVVCFLEPIALYPMRDLHEAGDGAWMTAYPANEERLPLGRVGQCGEGTDLAIISFANGFYLSRQAQPVLQRAGIDARIIDLRWLSPLPIEAMLNAVAPCKKVLVVDETRRSGGVSEGVVTALSEAIDKPVMRLAAEDSFVATGPAYGTTLPSRDSIVAAAKGLFA